MLSNLCSQLPGYKWNKKVMTEMGLGKIKIHGGGGT